MIKKNNFVKVHLCCGKNLFKDFINVDIVDFGQEIVHNLNKGLPFKNDSVDYIYCSNGLEHMDDAMFILKEVERVLKKDGTAYIRVPHFKNPNSVLIQHKHFFSWSTFNLLNEYFLDFKHLKTIKNELTMLGEKNFLLDFIPNIVPNIWEMFFPASEVHVTLNKTREYI